MPIVFVHGVPETPAVWDKLVRELDVPDAVRLRLPGFGCPRPDGFAATKEAYADWLIAELEAIGEPVDVVSHDWGGGLLVKVLADRPDLVRSWVNDSAFQLGDVDHVWHEVAKIWQTPGDGEAFFTTMAGLTPADRSAGFTMYGVPADDALVMAEAMDDVMGQCILDLYRSATTVGREWGPALTAKPAPPGLVLLPSEDTFTNGDGVRRVAAEVGARVVDLPGLGHWWMCQDPAAGAAPIRELWSTLD